MTGAALRLTRAGLGAALTAAAAAAPGPAAAKTPAKADALFRIGKADGSAREFGLTGATWRGYARAYPRPITYTVGTSTPRDWPYIHPSTLDTWAGGRAHTHTVRFRVRGEPPKKLYLIVGALAVWNGGRMAVAVNGKPAAGRRLPKRYGEADFAHHPDRWGRAKAVVFPLPTGAVRTGENTLAVTLDGGSWLVYDYVLLTPAAKPPKVSGESGGLLERLLEGPMADVEEVVFSARRDGVDGHWYANFGYYAPDERRKCYRDGAKLYKLNLRTGKLTTLLADPSGGIRDPQVHYDAKKILFSWRKGGTDHYDLFEIAVDGNPRSLRRLTDGPWDDIEATYTADGGIIFCSSRCKRWVNCWLTPVAVLHRCDGDGSNVRILSSNIEHDNTPWPLPDGRILYTRWEYVDRSQVHYHHLWVMNPDGTAQMVYFGNLHPGGVFIDAKPVPGTDKVVMIRSPGHGRREHEGQVALIDPNAGPDEPSFVRAISRRANYRDPYAFSEDCFLAASGRSLVVMDARGRTETLFTLGADDARADLRCQEPRPIRRRPRERRIAPRVDPRSATGRLVLADVRVGRNVDGVQPGEIDKLLVLETLAKPINFTGGMEPMSYGGTFTLARIVGTVPVEADGSAHLELPALRSFFFVALDKNDLSVKRMQSFLTVMPGEVTGCVGCHERRTETPRMGPAPAVAAAQRAPSRIRPVDDVPDVLDFPRDIQPILDRHCLKCHGVEKREGGVLLSGDRGPMLSLSYYALTARNQFSDGRNRPQSNYPPRALGSSASPLLGKLDGSHHDVRASARERKIVRLWIEVGAPYPGTYAALGSGMIGGYEQNRLDRRDLKWPSTQAAVEVMKRRCGSCHTGRRELPWTVSDTKGRPPWIAIAKIDPRRRRWSRHLLYDLTRPEKSVLLLGPLAKKAGGYELCKRKVKRDGKIAFDPIPPVFADTSDPAYQKILAAVRDAKKRLDEIKRFDMPGFRPRRGYLREMHRYGLLPAGTSATDVDYYALERRYWRSLWYTPRP